MNNTKCHKCSLVNPAGDVVCRRCGGILGLTARKSISEDKTKLPKYLFLLPLLLVALAYVYFSSNIKKSASEVVNVSKEGWQELTTDAKVKPPEPPVAPKPRNPLEGQKPVQFSKPLTSEESAAMYDRAMAREKAAGNPLVK